MKKPCACRLGAAPAIRRIGLRWLGVIWLFFPGAARSGDIALELHPPSIAVPAWQDEAEAWVVLNNGSATNIADPSLEFFSNDRLGVRIGPASATNAAPGASLSWLIRVTNLANARVPGAIQFESGFVSANRRARQQAFATLPVSLAAGEGEETPIGMRLEGAFDAIATSRPGEGYLVITNNLDVPVKLLRLIVQGPESIKESGGAYSCASSIESRLGAGEPASVGSSNAPAAVTVAAHATYPVPIQLHAQGRVTPGAYSVLLELPVEWVSGGRPQTRSVILAKQVTVGVFFESELLKALGVPSFLVLPGCLFVFTIQLLVSLGVWVMKNFSRLPQLGPASPGFWIIAITFSGLFAWVYTLVTRANYLLRYGVDDLRNVWLSSILIAVVFYFLVALVTSKWRKSRIPAAHDDPITILRKMRHRHRDTIEIAPVKFQIDQVAYTGFPVESLEDDQTLLWVVPKIVTKWGATPEALTAKGDFEQKVDARAKPGELAESLAAAERKKLVAVSWARDRFVPNPYHLKIESIAGYETLALIVT
jgi:hypothetical protein